MEPLAGALEERLRQRLVTLRKQKAEFIAAARREIAAYDGAISELRLLLGETSDTEIDQEKDG